VTSIQYNNIHPFSGLAPLPFVGREEEVVFYKNRYCLIDKITLEGQITGQCQSFQTMVDRKNELISRFSKSFQPFLIEEDGETVYYSPVSKVVSVNFGESKMMQLMPFVVELECYLEDLHSGFFGVLDPTNEFSFEEEDDKTVSLTHTCSARGIRTQYAEPLENAKDYVHSISGWSSQVAPLFVSGANSSLVLKTVQESIDRFSATYSLTETYKYDGESGAVGILRYSSELNSGDNGLVEVSIAGSIEGGRNTSLNDLRARYSGVNFYNLANSAYTELFPGVLNQTPVQFSFDEDSFTKSIQFSVGYDNDPSPNPFLIDTVQIQINKRGRNSISIDGRVRWRGNCLCNNEYGITQIKNFINSYDFYGHALRKWQQYGMATSLNPNPVSKSTSEDKNQCEYGIQLEFEEITSAVPDGLEFFEYTLNVRPAIPIYSNTPVICEGQYSIKRLRYDRRARFSIEGQAKIGECQDYDIGLQIVKNEINRLAAIYVQGVNKLLENLNITEGSSDSNRLIGFSASWTSEAPRIFNIAYDSA
jgi:hypothetical protein